MRLSAVAVDVDDGVAYGSFGAACAARVADQGAVDGHRGGAAAVQVDRVVQAERLGDRGRLVHRRTDACRLPPVDGGERDLAVARGAGDRARVAGEEAAGAGRYDDLAVGGEAVAAGHAV